jgi:uncharacterized protein (DUF2141 family)
MLKLMARAGVATGAAMLAATMAPAQPPMGPHAAACRAGSDQGAILVDVTGFKQMSGRVRVQLYRADGSFLERGQWIQRIDLPVSAGHMPVCVPVPRPGRYAIAVRHDVDGNGRSGWNDGAGFSRNPSLSLTNLRPSASQVAVAVGSGVQPIRVILNYRFGLSIHPVRG